MVVCLGLGVVASEASALVGRAFKGDEKGWVAALAAQPFQPGAIHSKLLLGYFQKIPRWFYVRNLRVAWQDGQALTRSSLTIVQPHY